MKDCLLRAIFSCMFPRDSTKTSLSITFLWSFHNRYFLFVSKGIFCDSSIEVYTSVLNSKKVLKWRSRWELELSQRPFISHLLLCHHSNTDEHITKVHTSMESVLYHCTSLISITIYRWNYEAQPNLCAASGGRCSSSFNQRWQNHSDMLG